MKKKNTSTDKQPENKNNNEKPQTYGNEPPVKDPKPAQQPSQYEVKPSTER